eukprot:gene11257-biopygen11553
MDLEAVDKTVEAFLRGLTRKVVCLYFDKQAVVATQSHFMSHNPDVWWDPYCEGVNALAYSWRGRGALDQPAVGTAGEVAHKLRATGARLWRHTGLANPGSGSWSQSRTRWSSCHGDGSVGSQHAGQDRAARAVRLGRSHVPRAEAPVSWHLQDGREAARHRTEPAEVKRAEVKRAEVFWAAPVPGRKSKNNTTWVPAKHVRKATLMLLPDGDQDLRRLQACTYTVLAFVSSGTPGAGYCSRSTCWWARTA